MPIANYITRWHCTDAAYASDTLCAGCFTMGASGVNKTYQAAIARTDLATGAVATNVTSASVPFDATDVGNYIWIPSGVTGFTSNRYRIISVTAGVAALDAAPAAANTTMTVGTCYLGGAMRSPGGTAAARGAAIYQIIDWTGVHVATNDSNNVANGRITLNEGEQWIGYHATPGDNVFSSTMLPVFSKTAAVGTLPLIVFWTQSQIRNCRLVVENYQLYTCNYNGVMAYRCWVTGGRIDDAIGVAFYECRFDLTGSTGGVTISGTAARALAFHRCYVRIATTINAMITATDSIIETTASPSTLILNTATMARMIFSHCDLITPNGSILDSTVSTNVTKNVIFDKCILWNNARTSPVVRSNEEHAIQLRQCAYPSDAAPVHDTDATLLPNTNPVPLATNPFVNTPGGDYSLTSTAKSLLRLPSAVSPGIPGFSQFGWIGAEPIEPLGGGKPQVITEVIR